MLNSWRKDIQYCLRLMAHSPGFALVAVLTLAVAIAANTTVFSWVDAIMLKPVPGVTDGRPTYSLEMLPPSGQNISYPDYLDFRANLKTLDGIAVSQEPIAFDIGENGTPRRLWGELVSGNYFSVLGVRPAAGRTFLTEEGAEKDLVAVISYRLWQEYFHGDPAIAGKTLRANRRNLTIIGVAARDFCGAWRGLAFDVWVPLRQGIQLEQTSQNILDWRGARGLMTVVRLKRGVTEEQARQEIKSLSMLLAARHPESNDKLTATLHSEEEAHNNVRFLLAGPLRILLAMCGVVLLIACANVANLLLARATARQREFSLRLALGANRAKLSRQLLTEAFLLACFGAMAGVPLALWARRALFLLMPATEYPISLDVPLNASVLIFTVLLCMLVTIVSGAAPALHAVRQELVNALKEGGRSGSAGAGTHRMRDLLVIGEVALALVALVGAGLFSKSFRAATAMDPGFDPKNMLVAKFFLSPSGYTDPAQRADFMLRLKDRLEATPGVIHAGYSESIPLGFGGAPGCGVDVPGYVPPRGESRAVDRNLVSPGFYKTLNVRMLSGRDFGPQDDARSAPVAIVSQSFAQHYFGGRDPVGQKINGCGVEVTIVGVSSEVKYYSFTQPLRPMIVVPLQQRYTPIHDYDRGLGVFIRTTGDPNQALPILRRAVASLDPAVGVYNAMAFEDYMGASVFPQRIAANLLTVLGCIALLLAAVGLYSVMAYSVSQRTHEIGIRMALGGQRSRVLGLVLKKGLALAFVGLTAGVVAALSVSQVAASMLLGVSATDPAIFAGASVFLLAIALVASLLPARRATKVDPMIALHCE